MKFNVCMTWLVWLLVVGPMAFAQDATTSDKNTKERIGVYDSRALAVAYGGSTAFSEWVNEWKAARRQAMAAEDRDRVKELDGQAFEEQMRLPKQMFTTEPVDNLLDRIKLALPKIKKKAGVDILLSKWDKKGLAKHPSAELVDVTMMLVDAFHPDPRARKAAIDVQKKEPVPPPDQPQKAEE